MYISEPNTVPPKIPANPFANRKDELAAPRWSAVVLLNTTEHRIGTEIPIQAPLTSATVIRIAILVEVSISVENTRVRNPQITAGINNTIIFILSCIRNDEITSLIKMIVAIITRFINTKFSDLI